MAHQILINSLIAGSIYGLVALSFSLIFSTTRFFHFAHASVVSLGAYGVLWALRTLRLPFALSLVAGIFLAALLGGLMELAIYRPMRKRKASSLVLLLASLGLFVVLQNLISVIFGDATQSIRVWEISESPNILGLRITRTQVAIIGVSSLFFITIGLLLKLTNIGRLMRALANDPELLRIRGVNIEQTILSVFLAGSTLAGIAGILMACDLDLTPLMGYRALLMGVAGAVVGGINRPFGAVLGGFLIGLVENFSGWWISVNWQEAIVFVVLVAFLLLRPQGFLGKQLKAT